MIKVDWIDAGREPQCEPNPAYPDGMHIDSGAKWFCRVDLPYPAKRCGWFYVECDICGTNAMITTAGRPDDPRSIDLPCKGKE
jgi:hypothetical protein